MEAKEIFVFLYGFSMIQRDIIMYRAYGEELGARVD